MTKDNWRKDDERNIHYFTSSVERFGTDVRALNWGSQESQRLRFSILVQVGQLSGASVLDVGCGMGDLYSWLKERGTEVEYTGADITPAMIRIAQQRFPKARFEKINLLNVCDDRIGQYDFVVASGIFTHRQVAPFDFLKAMVSKMFSLCKNAVAFNSLSSWAPEQEPDEFYADPLTTVAFCRTLTRWVVLRHDYHPRDFTVYMYKERNTS